MPDRWHIRGLHLAALAGFAISQPLFDILQRYPTFLVSHRLESSDVLLLTLLLGLCIPAIFFGLGWLISRTGKPLDKILHLSIVSLLLLATALPSIHRSGISGILAILLAGIASTGLCFAYVRSARLRGYFSWLALALIVFLIAFLTNRPIRTLVFGGSGTVISTSHIEGDTPVVLLIFDEFPVVSLMAADRQVDSVRYPHFAALSSQSHWFRNTSTVAAFTEQAVPAILTGTYPEGDRLPHHG